MKIGISFALLLLPAIASAEWSFEVRTDAFTDKSDYISSTRSTTSYDGVLGFNCINGLQAIVLRIGAHTEEFPMRIRTFRYRIDEGPIVEESSSMVRGTFIFMQGEPEFNALLPALQAGHTLTAEISDYRESSVRHVFSLQGSSTAINSVVSACT